jgi:proline-specific peptidase
VIPHVPEKEGIRMKEHEGYISVPGGRVWYRSVGEGGVPLLVLHGGPGFCHDYLERLEDLADRRQVVFFDQLGCGLSDRPDDTSLWTADFFVDEVDAVREALGLDYHHLFGNSWGGMLAMDYMIQRKPQLASVTVSNSPGSMARFVADCERLLSELPVDVQRTIRWHEERGYYSCMEYQGAVAYWYQKHMCRVSPWPDGLERSLAKAGMQTYETMWGPSDFHVTGNLRDWDVTARLHEITVPTLFIAGEHDEMTPEHVHDLHRLVPNSEYILYKGAAHMPFYEAHDRFIADVNGFFDRVEKAR